MVGNEISFNCCVAGADRFELGHRRDFVEAAFRRLAIEPGEIAHDGRAVAHMGCARAREFGGVLARLWQDAGVARLRQPTCRACGTGSRRPLPASTRTRLPAAFNAVKPFRQGRGRLQFDESSEMRLCFARDLCCVDEQLGLAGHRHDHERQHDGIVLRCRSRGC